MQPVYVAADKSGRFVSFWDDGFDGIRIYLPARMLGEHMHISPIQKIDLVDNKLSGESVITKAVVEYLARCRIYLDRSSIELSNEVPGCFHPRLWRGTFDASETNVNYDPIDPYQTYGSVLTQSIVGAESLFSALSETFRFIEPTTTNLNCFSHRNRELLILACTEVETLWRGFLESNGFKKKPPYNTQDYFLLNDILKLKDWTVGLTDYPDMDSFEPFADWTAQKPTQSLAWYDSYNGVKHNREVEFGRATLDAVLNSMAAVFIVQAAQWGPRIYDRFGYDRKAPFRIVSTPKFERSSIYIPFTDGLAPTRSVKYFDRAGQ